MTGVAGAEESGSLLLAEAEAVALDHQDVAVVKDAVEGPFLPPGEEAPARERGRLHAPGGTNTSETELDATIDCTFAFRLRPVPLRTLIAGEMIPPRRGDPPRSIASDFAVRRADMTWTQAKLRIPENRAQAQNAREAASAIAAGTSP